MHGVWLCHTAHHSRTEEKLRAESSTHMQWDPCFTRKPKSQRSWKDVETPHQLFCGESRYVFTRRTWAKGPAPSGSEESEAWEDTRLRLVPPLA